MFGLGNSIYAHLRSNIFNVKNLMMFMLGQIVKNVFGISRKP